MFKFLLFLPLPALLRGKDLKLSVRYYWKRTELFISISRFLFAFYDMRFSRYVFALYRFAIQCSGRLIEQAQTLDLQVAFAPLRHGFIRAVLEVSSEPSKRYMRESFTRPASRPKRYFNCDAFRIDFRSAKSSFRFPSPIDLGC